MSGRRAGTGLRAAGFDYAALPADLAAEAADVAERVRGRHRQTVETILEMGRDLLAIKARLPHGQFGAWLDAEFGGVARTAQNYMRAAEAFGARTETVSHLPPTTLYALASPSAPESVRAQVLARLDAGEPVEAEEVSEILSDARRLDRSREMAARTAARRARTPASRDRAAERARAEFDRLERETAERTAQRKAALATAVEILERRLGDERAAFLDALDGASSPYDSFAVEIAARLKEGRGK
jgi:hypothetical protein